LGQLQIAKRNPTGEQLNKSVNLSTIKVQDKIRKIKEFSR
jgi:hypothetical protein